MKRLFLTAALLLIGNPLFSQTSEEVAVRKTVEGFFEAFHKQDSMAMKGFMADTVVLQTTGRTKSGKTLLILSPCHIFLHGTIIVIIATVKIKLQQL